MTWTDYCDTGTTAMSTTSTIKLVKSHSHCYALKLVRANQHVRTEHRVCCCGKKILYTTRWADRSVEWRAA